jgi:bifunctional non-homologous end joining protein LigD
MLARPSELPHGSGYAFDVKWDGFRALVSTVGGLTVPRRRGWDMTHAVAELERLPEGLVLDGELIALGDDGLPSFPRISERVLHGRNGIPISYVIFDVLVCDAVASWRAPTPSAGSIARSSISSAPASARPGPLTTERRCSQP